MSMRMIIGIIVLLALGYVAGIKYPSIGQSVGL